MSPIANSKALWFLVDPANMSSPTYKSMETGFRDDSQRDIGMDVTDGPHISQINGDSGNLAHEGIHGSDESFEDEGWDQLEEDFKDIMDVIPPLSGLLCPMFLQLQIGSFSNFSENLVQQFFVNATSVPKRPSRPTSLSRPSGHDSASSSSNTGSSKMNSEKTPPSPSSLESPTFDEIASLSDIDQDSNENISFNASSKKSYKESEVCLRERSLSDLQVARANQVWDAFYNTSPTGSDTSDHQQSLSTSGSTKHKNECDNPKSQEPQNSSDNICNAHFSRGQKRVHFSTRLQNVKMLCVWTYASQCARTGPWENIARDRMRFEERIRRTEELLRPVLKKDYRTYVYNVRFKEDPSEQLARNRMRFLERIEKAEEILAPIFSDVYRKYVYKTRFRDEAYEQALEARARFQQRLRECEDLLRPIFSDVYRKYIYNSRFKEDPSEQIARNRIRFQERIEKAEDLLEPIFSDTYRKYVFNTRFKEAIESAPPCHQQIQPSQSRKEEEDDDDENQNGSENDEYQDANESLQEDSQVGDEDDSDDDDDSGEDDESEEDEEESEDSTSSSFSSSEDED